MGHVARLTQACLELGPMALETGDMAATAIAATMTTSYGGAMNIYKA